jgi:hypothetical protein
LVRHHIIDADLFIDLWALRVLGAWVALEEFIVNRRLVTGAGMYENFEYLVLLSERYMAKNPQGTFPRKFVRKQWPEAAERAHA